MNPRSEHYTAIAMLVVANLCWGLSFPLVKAIGPAVQQLVPDAGSWFITAMCVAPRFLLATAVLALLAAGLLRTITGPELRQGLVLGAALGAGLLFQNDGLQFTEASTSAFLTQFYAIMIPAWLALRARRAPPARIWVCGGLVLLGVALLARLDPRDLRLGRGELETLVSSVFFMVQIFVLDDRRYAGNRALPVTVVMFAALAVIFTLMALATAPAPAAVLAPWTSPAWLAFTLLLTLFCTLGAFTLMVKWQPKVTATEAGLLYCLEPVFTSALALFLPALLAAWAAIEYANERLTWNLLVGGGLITLANVILQLRPPARAPIPAAAATS
jgi:drug/metabolite transporter (DMT)-like permease